MNAKIKINISRLLAASSDIGEPGTPGSGASQITCDIVARRDGRWEAEGLHSTGCNQGYYQENYSHGPWRGRGDTPESAVRDMVSRADDAYQGDMRRAGHDALLEVDGVTYESLAGFEADRLQSIIDGGERQGCRYAQIAMTRHYVDADERMDLRRRAVRALRRVSSRKVSDLANVSDAELLAEVERRGLTVEAVG